jgi:hypothetical protein
MAQLQFKGDEKKDLSNKPTLTKDTIVICVKKTISGEKREIKIKDKNIIYLKRLREVQRKLELTIKCTEQLCKSIKNQSECFEKSNSQLVTNRECNNSNRHDTNESYQVLNHFASRHSQNFIWSKSGNKWIHKYPPVWDSDYKHIEIDTNNERAKKFLQKLSAETNVFVQK